MYETFCIFCGNKLDWSADFTYEEIYLSDDEKDKGRVITEMFCRKCGAEATFVAPQR